MGKVTGFKEFERQDETYTSVIDRVKNYKEFTVPLSEKEITKQGSRCMDCGIPFCHSGCPLGNLIPDFNHMVHQGEWQKASWILHSTNNFPEFTGRLCPAPCEQACVLGIIEDPVSIENIEKNIVERAFKEGWIKPQLPKIRTDKTIAVIGSGPAGLAAAQQLNRAGHTVTVFERDDEVGGLLRYGIPNFKMEKGIIDRRIAILKAEGIIFKTDVNVGVNYDVEDLKAFDSIVLCGGSTEKRSLPTQGIDADGVVQAMDFLTQQTKALFGKEVKNQIMATGKDVIVIGGGDTGSDFLLLQLGSTQNEQSTITKLKSSSFNAFWNGWDANNTVSSQGVGIHHPAGDIKKISTYTSSIYSDTYGGNVSGTHWSLSWTSTQNGHGITEGGSSGSPLFTYNNGNSRIINTSAKP